RRSRSRSRCGRSSDARASTSRASRRRRRRRRWSTSRGRARAGAEPTSSGVTPRWEWRTFGESFGDAETRLGELTPELEEESDDLYLLSVASNASVKVRGGRLDMK